MAAASTRVQRAVAHLRPALASGARAPLSTAEAGAKLSADRWTPFKLLEKNKYNHNSATFKFALHQSNAELPVASLVMTRAVIDGKEVTRPYTPITFSPAKGVMELLIKAYPQGTMSRHVHSLKPGDTLEFKGPFGKVAYSSTYRKHIGMVAGGTGITPMLQVLRAALSNKEDRTRFTLVFANISLDDVLLKAELDQLAARHPNFQVHYVLQQAPPNWTGSTGFVTKELLRSKLPPPGPDACIFVCGPPPMMNAISGDKMPDKSQGPVQGVLKELGYDNSSVYKF